jgi:hypothetical protein
MNHCTQLVTPNFSVRKRRFLNTLMVRPWWEIAPPHETLVRNRKLNRSHRASFVCDRVQAQPKSSRLISVSNRVRLQSHFVTALSLWECHILCECTELSRFVTYSSFHGTYPMAPTSLRSISESARHHASRHSDLRRLSVATRAATFRFLRYFWRRYRGISLNPFKKTLIRQNF